MIIIVAKDGTGDHISIQDAVDAANEGDVIYIRPGIYEGRVIINKDMFTLRGEDAADCVITAGGCAKDRDETGKEKGTFLSWTLLVTGNDVLVRDLTVRNDAGDGSIVGQAVAVYAAGDRDVWKNVRMIAHQDTLFCGPTMPKVQKDALPWQVPAGVESVGDCPAVYSRQYFEDCFIRGDVDFIFGPYRCYFEKCMLYMNERGGYYTAANTPEECEYGMVFHECLLTGEGKGYLGRPWRRFARTAFIDCEMDEHVNPWGFCDWDENRVVTDRLCEYGTRGACADMSLRHPAEGRITAQDAAHYSKTKVLDGWTGEFLQVYMAGDSTMCDYPHSAFPRTGWGQALKRMVIPDARVCNCAVSGRSTKSFISEGHFQRIKMCMEQGDCLIIQFGHNDEKLQDPLRGTQPEGEYIDNLRMFVSAARTAGVTPILMTSIARRRFEDGVPAKTHGVYPDACKKIAEEENVLLIDHEAITMEILMRTGEEGSKELYNWVSERHPNYPEGEKDNSHLCLNGARIFAEASGLPGILKRLSMYK